MLGEMRGLLRVEMEAVVGTAGDCGAGDRRARCCSGTGCRLHSLILSSLPSLPGKMFSPVLLGLGDLSVTWALGLNCPREKGTINLPSLTKINYKKLMSHNETICHC